MHAFSTVQSYSNIILFFILSNILLCMSEVLYVVIVCCMIVMRYETTYHGWMIQILNRGSLVLTYYHLKSFDISFLGPVVFVCKDIVFV